MRNTTCLGIYFKYKFKIRLLCVCIRKFIFYNLCKYIMKSNSIIIVDEMLTTLKHLI